MNTGLAWSCHSKRKYGSGKTLWLIMIVSRIFDHYNSNPSFSVIIYPFDLSNTLVFKACELLHSRFYRLKTYTNIAKNIQFVAIALGARQKIDAVALLDCHGARRVVHIDYIASRRRGRGADIVRAIQQSVRKNRYTVTAEVRTNNPAAKTFFSRLGFKFKCRNTSRDSQMCEWTGCLCCL